MTVGIDPHSGFCGGVIRAISRAEQVLESGERLLSLGEIVHNEEELRRLASLGLETVDKSSLTSSEGVKLLIRAHGEPPEEYDVLRSLGYEIVDCTCPVVLGLQRSIRDAYLSLKDRGGQILIYGKIGHPEVLGLVGQADGDAVVVEDSDQLSDAVAGGRLDTSLPTDVFSQTTMDPSGYEALCSTLTALAENVTVHRTICSQVARRHERLRSFATENDVVVFVAGSSSSNGKVLSGLCFAVNPRTYVISSPEELRPEWFRPSDRVGVSGATSTPRWLLEKVAGAIENLQ